MTHQLNNYSKQTKFPICLTLGRAHLISVPTDAALDMLQRLEEWGATNTLTLWCRAGLTPSPPVHSTEKEQIGKSVEGEENVSSPCQEGILIMFLSVKMHHDDFVL